MLVTTKKNKVRIQLKSFNCQKLIVASLRIFSLCAKHAITFTGSISLPTKKRIYCLLRSPHINKKSREHFEIRIYTKIIDLYMYSYSNIKFFIPLGVKLRFLS